MRSCFFCRSLTLYKKPFYATNNHITGAYSEWTDTDEESENYCANTPFMMAFVLLILVWILMPLIFCLTCCCCCLCCAMGAAKARTQPNDEEEQPNTEATEAKDVA